MTDEHAQPTAPAPPVRQTDKLAEALATAQGEFKPLKRTRTVKVKMKGDKGTYSFKYAPLDECIAATRPALSKHGLAVVQVFQTEPGPNVTTMRIVTTMLHSSGQFIVSTLPLRAHGTPQELGTDMTYMRRYSYVAIVNIAADEDTDGPPPPGAGSYEHEPTGPPAAPQGGKGDAKKPPPNDKPKGLSRDQLKRLFKIAHDAGWNDDQIKTELLLRYKAVSSKDLTKPQYDELCGNKKTKVAGLLETPPPTSSTASPQATTQAEQSAGANSSSAPKAPSTDAGGGGDDLAVYMELGNKVLKCKNDGGDLEALRAEIRTAGGLTPETRAELYKQINEAKE